MQNTIFSPIVYLQLLADGGNGDGGATGVTGSAAESQEGVTQNPTAEDASDRVARFEQLIKGEFKDLYDARMQDTVQKRLKGSKETVEKFNSMQPMLEMLGGKYGVDHTDIAALSKAIEDDDSYYESEAYEKGLSVAQLKEMKKMERENATLRQAMEKQREREEFDAKYSQWMQESEKIKAIYPSFNFAQEMENEEFQRLLFCGINPQAAYEVIHKDEIIPAAMQYSAQKTAQNMSHDIMARGKRPAENGTGAQSTANVISDVARMTREQRAELAQRAARGEKIILR